MKKFKKITKSLAAGTAAAVLLTAYPLPAGAEEVTAGVPESPWVSEWQEGDAYSVSEDAYQIYPVPQSVDYTGSEGAAFVLPDEVSVVAGEGIDRPTLGYLEEVLGEYGRTGQPAENAQGEGNIVLGVLGTGDQADLWFREKGLDAEVFDQPDAYALYAEDGNIYILGKDTDAAFRGVATLKMMFSSFAGERFLPVRILDYASIDARGYIEGFYGGWTHEQRKSLMEFTRDIKMNIYVYASKTDPYHTSKWAELYPDEMIGEFRELTALQEEMKCEFSWSVHLTNMLSGITSTADPRYEERKQQLMDKFDQLYEIGVRRFCILNDDFGSGSNEVVVSLINDLNEEYVGPKGCENIIYCPQGYNNSWARPAELEAMRGFDEDVLIFWTGLDVNSPFEQSSIDYVIENTGHSPVFWVNYPCSEHAKSGVFLGSSAHYIRDDITGLAGAVSNPIFFAEADKVALFQLGAYFWNVNNYSEHTEEVWEQCFKYLQPEVYDAYLTIARNVSDCPGSGRVPQGFEESLYIKETLESVRAKIESGTDISQDTEALELLAEFIHIQSAADEFVEYCENDALVRELSNPGNTDGGEGWIQALKNVAKAGELLLTAEMEMGKDSADLGKVWESFASASAEMGRYSERTYLYPDGASRPAVKAASKRLVPFVEYCLEDVRAYMDGILAEANEETAADRVYTNIEEYAAAPLTICEKEYGLRNIGRITLEPGEYIGIKKKDIAEISEIMLEGSGLDGLSLEYSLHGDKWTEAVPGKLGEAAQARYVRLANAGQESVSAVLSKLAVTVENLEPEITVEDTVMSLQPGDDWSETVDGSKETYIETARDQKKGDYIIFDLGLTQEIHDIAVFAADGAQRIYQADLSVSSDNAEYKKIKSFRDDGVVEPPVRKYEADADGISARYIKLEITADADAALRLYEIEVNRDTQRPGRVDPAAVITNTSGNTENINDRDLSSVFLAGDVKEGDYLEYRITGNVNVEKIRILQNGSCGAEVLAVRPDGTEETLGILTAADQTFEAPEGGIYAVRLELKAGVAAEISEIVITYGEDASGDVGQAVDNIYLDVNVPDSAEEVNLALNRPVEVSGVETSSVKPESAVDGTKDTKWDSGALKGAGASSPQWIIVDLGGYSNMISGIEMSYYNKVYPTDYDIQVSDDKENWVTVKTITHENNGPTYPVDTVEDEFAVPVMARYVRLLFRSINSGAAGNCIGLQELEVAGVRRHAEMEYVSVQEMEDQTVEIGAEVRLPEFVQAAVRAEADGEETAVMVMPEWEPAEVDTSADGETDVLGSLPYRYNLSNPQGCEIAFAVTVGAGSEEPDQPDPGEDDTDLVKGSKVEVSDVEWELDGSAQTDYTGELAVDGDSGTRWSSGPLNDKSYGEVKDQWLVLDLGGHTAYISSIRIDYYRKVWPTSYRIQVSDDRENWIDIKTYDRGSSDEMDITDTVSLDIPVMARYIRLYYPAGGLNENAAGGSVSIKEIAVTGQRAAEGTVYKAVEETLDQIKVQNDASVSDLGLEQLLSVKLEEAGRELTVQVIPVWDTEGWEEAEDAELEINGILPVGDYVANPEGIQAVQTVVKGSPSTEDPDPEEPDPENPDPENPDPEDPKPEEPGTEEPDPEEPKPEEPGAEEPGEDGPKEEGTDNPGTEGQNGGDSSKAVPTGDAANAGWIYAAVLSGAAAAVLYKRKRRS